MEKKTKIITLWIFAVILLGGIITICCTVGGNNCEHEWEFKSNTATCDCTGTITYICKLCNKTKTEFSGAKGHKWEQTSTVAATCTEDGQKIYTCSRCNKTKSEKVSSTGHKWKETNNTATCTTGGVKTYTCNVCNETKTENSVALGHYWRMTNTVAATCTEAGEKTCTCYYCNETKTEKISAHGHSFSSYGVCQYCKKFKYNINLKGKLPAIYSYRSSSRIRTSCKIEKVDFEIQDGYLVAFFYGYKTYDIDGVYGMRSVHLKYVLKDSKGKIITSDERLLSLVVGQQFGDNGYFREKITKISNLSLTETYILEIVDYIS